LPGFHWTVPLTIKSRISQRVINFETARLKVADGDGNPVEIAAAVVWKVSDTVVLCGDRSAQPVVNTGTLYG
jgi:hypothetical protein